jgi:adenylylsulfate reductase subunit B
MPPIIDYDKCVACGTCDECPGDVIHFEEGPEGALPVVKYPEECWYCGSCRQDCPQGAITILFSPAMLVI